MMASKFAQKQIRTSKFLKADVPKYLTSYHKQKDKFEAQIANLK